VPVEERAAVSVAVCPRSTMGLLEIVGAEGAVRAELTATELEAVEVVVSGVVALSVIFSSNL
jgi:hypothetical protein